MTSFTGARLKNIIEEICLTYSKLLDFSIYPGKSSALKARNLYYTGLALMSIIQTPLLIRTSPITSVVKNNWFAIVETYIRFM